MPSCLGKRPAVIQESSERNAFRHHIHQPLVKSLRCWREFPFVVLQVLLNEHRHDDQFQQPVFRRKNPDRFTAEVPGCPNQVSAACIWIPRSIVERAYARHIKTSGRARWSCKVRRNGGRWRRSRVFLEPPLPHEPAQLRVSDGLLFVSHKSCFGLGIGFSHLLKQQLLQWENSHRNRLPMPGLCKPAREEIIRPRKPFLFF